MAWKAAGAISPGAASTASCGLTSTQSAKSTSCGGYSTSSRPSVGDVAWEKIRLAHRIRPYYLYAHCADDVRLLSVFLDQCELADIDGDSVQLLLKTFKFLRSCDYNAEDICSILAHASSYFEDAWDICGNVMNPREVGNVIATLMFIAHSYVQDETCPLRIWHKHLFRDYCPLGTLSAAVIRLMEIRKFRLRLESKDLHQRFTRLMSVTIGCRA